MGVDVIKAIEMVTINPSSHYNLDAGAIVTGAKADFIIIDNVYEFNILKTYIAGECVFDGENVLFDVPEVKTQNTIKVNKKTAEDFDILFDGDECEVNVIECYNGELLTGKTTAKLITKDGKVQSDIFQDVLKYLLLSDMDIIIYLMHSSKDLALKKELLLHLLHMTPTTLLLLAMIQK